MTMINNKMEGGSAKRMGMAAMLALSAFAMQGCADMDRSDRRTVGGAAIGAVAGAALGGTTAAVVGGAAVGGIIGHETARDDRRQWNDEQRRRYNEQFYRDHGYYPDPNNH